MKVAFVDRDGTINNDYEDYEWKYVNSPVFIDGSLKALNEIKERGYKIIIITNQYLINDGIITLTQYKEFTDNLIKELKNNGIDILDISYCPHSRNENCNCFKPKTGLIDIILKKYPDIELDKSFLVGDSICDVELGNKFNITTFGININSLVFNYIRVNSLLDTIKYL